MADQVVSVGDKVHVVTRRLFDGDNRRNFVGEVTRSAGDLHEVVGYAFIFQAGKNVYVRRQELRTRIFALGDAGLIVIKLPRDVEIASVEYQMVDGHLVATDGAKFSHNFDEFGHSR